MLAPCQGGRRRQQHSPRKKPKSESLEGIQKGAAARMGFPPRQMQHLCLLVTFPGASPAEWFAAAQTLGTLGLVSPWPRPSRRIGTAAGHRMNAFQLWTTMTVAKPLVRVLEWTTPTSGCVVRSHGSNWPYFPSWRAKRPPAGSTGPKGSTTRSKVSFSRVLSR